MRFTSPAGRPAAASSSSGNSGRPSMVKWSPSTRSNSWMPRALELIAADARQRRVADRVEIAVEKGVGKRAHGQMRGLDVLEQHRAVAHHRHGRMQRVGRAAQAPRAARAPPARSAPWKTAARRAPASGRRRARSGRDARPPPPAPSRAPAAPRPRRVACAPARASIAALVDIGRARSRPECRRLPASARRAALFEASTSGLRGEPQRHDASASLTSATAGGARPAAPSLPRRFPRSSGASRR